MRIKICDLDLSCQTRAGTDAEHICEIAEKMVDGVQFPKVVVFKDEGGALVLADGFHRVMALRQNGKNFVDADVMSGSRLDAILYGGTANNNQGKIPTRADVRHFLEMVWENREYYFRGTPTGGNLADKCGVSTQTGNRFVKEKLGDSSDAPTMPMAELKPPVELIGKNGRKYSAPVKSIAPTMPMAELSATVKAPVKAVPNVFRDRNGTHIPKRLEGVFASSFLRDIAGSVSGAKCEIERAMSDKSPDVAKLSNRVIAYLQNAYQELKSAMPFCVCPVCKGEGCMACGDVGYQNEDQFKRTPKEMR